MPERTHRALYNPHFVILALVLLSALLLSACNLSSIVADNALVADDAMVGGDPVPQIEAPIQVTPTIPALDNQMPTETSAVGTISGKLCFPSERIPPMNLYLTNMSKNKFTEISISENQLSYQVQVEPGEYLAYAWTLNFELAGGYTHDDHRLRSFTVAAGESVSGIDICDWYGEPGSIPRPSADKFGAISGRLSFPSEVIPPLRVVAIDIYNDAYHWVDTVDNQQTYEIKNLMPGYYVIVAYEINSGFAGGYTEAAKCGLGPGCPEDHTLVTIYVTPGDQIVDINPADWYAPPGTFPPDPTR